MQLNSSSKKSTMQIINMRKSYFRYLLFGTFFIMLALGGLAAVGSVQFQAFSNGKVTHYEVDTTRYARIDGSGDGELKTIFGAKSVDEVVEMAAANEALSSNVYLLVQNAGNREAIPTVLGRSLLLRISLGFNLPDLEAIDGISHAYQIPGKNDFVIANVSSIDGAIKLLQAVSQIPGVVTVQPTLGYLLQKNLVPNDPIFSEQWHLLNLGQNGGDPRVHVNVINTWDTYRGSGIDVGVVDDGLQYAHPDLFANSNTTIDYDYLFFDDDPAPTSTQDSHGTAVGGLIGAVGNNGVGVTGVAFESNLIGLKLLGSGGNSFNFDVNISGALSHSNSVIEVKNNSWGPLTTYTFFDPIFPPQINRSNGSLTETTLDDAVSSGRNGLGTILVFAAGNDGNYNDDVNQSAIGNASETIAVAAINNDGERSSYSTEGASLITSAPAGLDSFSGNLTGVTTTDLAGLQGYNPPFSTNEVDLANLDYTSRFNGTSAAAPIVSGVIALILEANPALGWRDVQEILLRSSSRFSVDFSFSADWVLNTAGIYHSYQYGAGLVNAGNAVALAQVWTNLADRVSISLDKRDLAQVIPDFSNVGVTYSFDVPAIDFRVEHVELNVEFGFGRANDLELILTAPSGTSSVLAEQGFGPENGYPDWTFTTVRNWGEQAAGAWTLTIKDRGLAGTSTLNNLSLRLHGTSSNTIPEVTVASASVEEGNVGDSNTLDFNLSLSQPVSNDISIDYSLTPLSFGAIPGQSFSVGADYVDLAGSLTIAAGATNAVVSVPIIPDVIEEPNEFIQLNLFNATGANILQSAAVGAILNDDGLTASVSDVVGIEPDSGVTNTVVFDVTLSQVHSNSVNISYALLNGEAILGSDFYGTNGVVIIAPGSTNATVSIDIIGDDMVEADETFSLVLTSILNDSGFSEGTLADGTGIATIQDNEPRFLFSDLSITEGDSQVVTGNLDVNLTKVATEQVTVSYYSTNLTAKSSSDYTGVSGSLSFPVGSTNQVIFLSILPDLVDENDEEYQIVFSSVTGPAALTNDISTITIVDNDPLPSVSISDVMASEGGAGQTNFFQFPIQLSQASGRTVAVDYQTSVGTAEAGVDYIGGSGRVHIQAGQTTGMIPIRSLGDDTLEANETFNVTISIPSELSRAQLGVSSATGTILNDDAVPVVSLSDLAVPEGDNINIVNVPVIVAPPSGLEITIVYSTTDGTAIDGSDYTAVSGGQVILPAGASSGVIPITVNGENVLEGNESFTVSIDSVTNGTAGAPSSATVEITNDDGPVISIGSVLVAEGDAGNNTASLPVSLSEVSASQVRVEYTLVDGTATSADSDYVVINGAVKIDPGELATTIEVDIVGDETIESDEVLQVVLSNPTAASISVGTATLTIEDDDAIADISVSLQETPTSLFTGHDGVFTVNIQNLGPEIAENVVVTNKMFAGIELVGVSGGNSIVTNAPTDFDIQIGSLTNGQLVTATYIVRPSATGSFEFKIGGWSDNPDETTSNNTVDLAIPVADPVVSLSLSGSMTVKAESIQPANGSLENGEVVTLGFFVQNTGNVATTNVVATVVTGGGVTAVTSTATLGVIDAGAISSEGSVQVMVDADASSSVTVTISLSDETASGSVAHGSLVQSFSLPTDGAIANSTPILVPGLQGQGDAGSGAGSANPSVISVSGRAGVVDDVIVSLMGVSHEFASDMDILLVGPQGQSAVLMSDAAGGDAVAGVNLTFSVSATSVIPRTGGVTSGTWLPTDYAETVPDKYGYSGTPNGTDLGVFDGTDPNGDWMLYTWDDVNGEVGMIEGWSLAIKTVEPAAGSAGLQVTIASAEQFYQGSNSVVTVTVLNQGPATATGVMFTNNVPSGTSLVGNVLPSQGIATLGTGEVVTALGAINVGQSATISYTLLGQSIGAITHSVSAYGNETDLNPSNNIASDEARVNRVAALAVGGQSGLTESGFEIMLSAPDGVTYVIEASDDLITWTQLATEISSAGMIQVTDGAATTNSFRFYRAVEQ